MLLRVKSAHHLVTFFETLQLQPFAIRRTASVAGGKGVEALLNACRHIRNSSSASLKQNIPFDQETVLLVIERDILILVSPSCE